MTPLDVIDRLPFELQARLESDEYFQDVPVLVAEEGNIQLELAQKQAVITTKYGKRGVAVVVLQVVADDEHTNIQFGPLTLKPAFQVVENLELNRDQNGTGKSARRVARRIRDVIKGSGLAGMVIDMKPDRPCIEPVHLPEGMGKIVKAYQVSFTCLEASSESPIQVGAPVFTATGGSEPQFTITCPTPGATIYYTTDDSYPKEGNPAAKIYAGPVDLPADPAQPLSLTVRACAYVPGMVASWVERKTIQSQLA